MYPKRALCPFLRPEAHEMPSCITPRGQSVEQYTRPNKNVNAATTTNATMFNAKIAGTN
jgi:hypothetical protein